MPPASIESVRSIHQRVSARGSIALKYLDGRTRLHGLYQEGAAKIRMPARAADPLEAVLINTAGGLTGGDRLEWHVEQAPGTSAVVTTQACEKVYRASEDRAEVSVTASIGRDARFAWLPQETIVFDQAAFVRTLSVDLAVGAEALILEATVFGRSAMGESVRHAAFRDRWRVSRAGRLIHAADFSVGPQVSETLRRSATAGGAIAMATVLLVCEDAESRLDAVRSVVGDGGGASAWRAGGTGKLLARLLASDGYTLRRRLVPLIELLNGQAGLPKVWSL